MKTPLYNGVKIKTDGIFMSSGQILVPVHTMRAMSLGHTNTFTFCVEYSCISWRQDKI